MKQKWIAGIGIANLIFLIALGVYLVLSFGKSSGKAVVFIDLTKVYNEFSYKKEVENLLNRENESRRYKSDSLETALNQGMLSGQLNPKMQAQLEKEITQSIRQYEEGMRQLTTHYDQLIWNAINKYVYEFGKEREEELILGTKGEGNIMYATESKDISQEVVNFINTAYGNEK